MTTPSHRLKIYRSDDHLKEMQTLLAKVRGRREYPMVKSMKPQHKGPAWDYILDLSSINPPETFPIVLGDYLFNIRSGLDHLIVAIAPRKYRRDVSFPICTADPFAADESSGDYLDADAVRRWNTATRGLPDECIAALKVLQPYEAVRLHGKRSAHHALALLSALQNADKHRELVGVLTGLENGDLTINGHTERVTRVLPDQAIVVRAESEMNVKIEGAAIVGVQWGKEVFGVGDLVDRLARFLTDELLPRMEPFL